MAIIPCVSSIHGSPEIIFPKGSCWHACLVTKTDIFVVKKSNSKKKSSNQFRFVVWFRTVNYHVGDQSDLLTPIQIWTLKDWCCWLPSTTWKKEEEKSSCVHEKFDVLMSRWSSRVWHSDNVVARSWAHAWTCIKNQTGGVSFTTSPSSSPVWRWSISRPKNAGILDYSI